MKREQLEHFLRAAARIVDEPDFLVIGSVAILGTYDDDQLPYEASRSDGWPFILSGLKSPLETGKRLGEG